MINFHSHGKGILLSVLLGTVAWIFAPYIPKMNEILLGLILGILVSNLITIPTSFQDGISFTGSKLLELSILFLAFSINLSHIADLGWQTFMIVLVVVFAIILLTLWLSIKMKCPGSTGWLIGFGTAICGSSAIAALAPSVSKNKEDIGIAMAVINLFGIIGMIAFPAILPLVGWSLNEIGLMIGGTLHSVGNVAGAAYAMNKEIGDAAITVKLARVALLSPALIFFNYIQQHGTVKNWKEHFKLPWYLWAFIGISILVTFIPLPTDVIKLLETIGKAILTVAMAAIGLKVKFSTLYQSGKKGMVFGLIIFVLQILLVFIWIMMK
ncbi:MAG: putative sulfate exporter family transporter [Flavobacteriales bacterium]|nr:putative sulfate exporter family transporter [Flavobacteriales bacterium]